MENQSQPQTARTVMLALSISMFVVGLIFILAVGPLAESLVFYRMEHSGGLESTRYFLMLYQYGWSNHILGATLCAGGGLLYAVQEMKGRT